MNTKVFPQVTSFRETELTDQSFDDYDCYATHDNGGRSFVFQVRKDKKVVKIFQDTFTTQARKETCGHMVHQDIELDNGSTISRDGMYYKDPIIECEAYFKAFIKELKTDETPFEIYIGVDTTKEEYGYEGGDYTGAAILIRFPQKGNECWFFCTRIMNFTINEPIQAVYCPIGNNDVVYPYLMSETKCYCIEEWERGGIHSIEKEKVAVRPPRVDIHEHLSLNRSSWTKVESSFLSERIGDNRDTTVPLTSL